MVRFKRVLAAFEEVARVRPCDSSSGSEHSPETMTDLSDLVNSFLEREYRVIHGSDAEMDGGKEGEEIESESFCPDSEMRDRLMELLGCEEEDDGGGVKRRVRAVVEKARREVAEADSSPGFKRRLMARLRERGYDAGLCKSKWEKTGRFPSGSYEYVDVNVAGNRYIIEFSIAREFQIARPTNGYTSLLDNFPEIFVATAEELKQVVRLMSRGLKKSMKSKGLYIPPWRRHGYMQAKWFGAYKRTVNELPAAKISSSEPAKKRAVVGFTPTITYFCRDDFASKVGPRVGNLTVTFNDLDTI